MMISHDVEKAAVDDKSPEKNRDRWYIHQLLPDYAAVTNNPKMSVAYNNKG